MLALFAMPAINSNTNSPPCFSPAQHYTSNTAWFNQHNLFAFGLLADDYLQQYSRAWEIWNERTLEKLNSDLIEDSAFCSEKYLYGMQVDLCTIEIMSFWIFDIFHAANTPQKMFFQHFVAILFMVFIFWHHSLDLIEWVKNSFFFYFDLQVDTV